ncbi:MAG TPA: response regulator [Polyangiaceae bacterium]|nr:response regulator [Polyangiaceae bacterium]
MTTPEPMRALIVEDDPVVARSIARRLLREGYTVSLAGTCRAARAARAGFHVAVLDLDLPDGSGAELADELLRLGSARGVVFYTGTTDHVQRERAQRLGHVIDKAQHLDAVVSVIEPFAAEPPISQHAPAPRPRPRVSGARLARVSADEETLPDGVVSSSSSRR